MPGIVNLFVFSSILTEGHENMHLLFCLFAYIALGRVNGYELTV